MNKINTNINILLEFQNTKIVENFAVVITRFDIVSLLYVYTS